MAMNRTWKKGFVWLMLGLMMALTACGGSSTPASTNTDNTSPSSDSQANTANVETITMNMNIALPPNVYDWEPKYKATEEFARLIEERTDGRVKINLFFNNQLVGQAEAFDALAKGTVELVNSASTAWVDRMPEGLLINMPFWSMGEEHAMHILRNTEVGKIYEEILEEHGIKLLMYYPTSITGYMSTKPIASVADMKGLVMNTASSFFNDFYQAMGLGVATVPYAEQYEGLMRGTIDVIQYPFYSLETYKLHEVIDYLTLPPTVNPAIGFVTISKIVWDGLPTDIQEIFLQTAREMEEAAIEGSKRYTENVFQFAEEHDVEIVRMTEEAYQEIYELAQEKVWAKFAAISDRAKRMVDILQEETAKWVEENPEARQYWEQFLQK